MFSRTRRHSSGSSIPGIIQSVSNTSIGSACNMAHALSPSLATRHSWPKRPTIALRVNREVASSSATRTFMSDAFHQEIEGGADPGELRVEPLQELVRPIKLPEPALRFQL